MGGCTAARASQCSKDRIMKQRKLGKHGPLAVELTSADLAQLDQAIPPGAAAGMRYPEGSMKAVNR